jgi:hypothetical protein
MSTCVIPSTSDHVHSPLLLCIKLQPHRLHLVTVTLPLYVYVCQGMTTPVHSIHYSLQRLLQIMCNNCKKILSLTLLRKSRPTDISTFPFAAYTTTKSRACEFPNSFPFLTAPQANATKLRTSWSTPAVKCLVYVHSGVPAELPILVSRRPPCERSVTVLF